MSRPRMWKWAAIVVGVSQFVWILALVDELGWEGLRHVVSDDADSNSCDRAESVRLRGREHDTERALVKVWNVVSNVAFKLPLAVVCAAPVYITSARTYALAAAILASSSACNAAFEGKLTFVADNFAMAAAVCLVSTGTVLQSNSLIVRVVVLVLVSILAVGSSVIASFEALGLVPLDFFTGSVSPPYVALALLPIAGELIELAGESEGVAAAIAAGYMFTVTILLHGRAHWLIGMCVAEVGVVILSTRVLLRPNRRTLLGLVVTIAAVLPAVIAVILKAATLHTWCPAGAVWIDGVWNVLMGIAFTMVTVSNTWTGLVQRRGACKYDNERLKCSPLKPCPSMWSSILILGGAASASWVLLWRDPLYPSTITFLAVISALNHSRPYGAGIYDGLDVVDRLAILTVGITTARIMVTFHSMWLQAIMSALFGALTVTYIYGTCRAVHWGASQSGAWLQVITHALAASAFVACSIGHRLGL